MTRNQIAYQDLQEKKRSNLINEGETYRHNLVTEKQADFDLTTKRRAQRSKSFNDYISPWTKLSGDAAKAVTKLI